MNGAAIAGTASLVNGSSKASLMDSLVFPPNPVRFVPFWVELSSPAYTAAGLPWANVIQPLVPVINPLMSNNRRTIEA